MGRKFKLQANVQESKSAKKKAWFEALITLRLCVNPDNNSIRIL
jgi:hypothetical protein